MGLGQFFNTDVINDSFKTILTGKLGTTRNYIPGHETLSFSIEENGQITDSVTLLIPAESMQTDEPQRVKLTKTQGGTVEDDFGPDNKSIVIKGSIYEYYVGQNDNIQNLMSLYKTNKSFFIGPPKPVTLSQTGQEGIEDLEHIMRYRESYLDLAETFGSSYSTIKQHFKPKFIFSNWKKGKHYYATLMNYSINYNKSEPFTYFYEIRLTTLSSYMNTKYTDDFLKKINTREAPIDFSLDIVTRLAAGIDIIDEVFRPYTQLTNQISHFNEYYIQPLRFQISQLIAGKRDVIDTSKQLATDGLNYLNDKILSQILSITIESLANGYFIKPTIIECNLNILAGTLQNIKMIDTIYQETATITLKPGTQVEATTNTAISTSNLLQESGEGESLNETDFLNSSDLTSSFINLVNIIKTPYVISEGDTLKSISRKYFNTALKWADIAKFNNLIKEIDDTYAGQTIFIPIPAQEISRTNESQVYENINALLQSSDYNLMMKTLLGSDFASRNGDHYVDDTGDLAIMSGYECLKQNIQDLFTIEQGTLNPYFFFYGVPNFKSIPNSNILLQFLGIVLRKSILVDTRIDDIVSLNSKIVEDQMFIDIGMRIKNWKDILNVNVKA